MTTLPRSPNKKLRDAIDVIRENGGSLAESTDRLRKAALGVLPGTVHAFWDLDVLTVEETELLMRWRTDVGLKP